MRGVLCEFDAVVGWCWGIGEFNARAAGYWFISELGQDGVGASVIEFDAGAAGC